MPKPVHGFWKRYYNCSVVFVLQAQDCRSNALALFPVKQGKIDWDWRRTMMKTIYAISIAALSLCVSAHGTTFKTDDQFSLTLSGDWKEIPGAVLQNYSNKMQQRFPNVHWLAYCYGYQLKTSRRWFSYPYILVQINNNEKIAPSGLGHDEMFPADLQQLVGRMRQGLSGCISGASADAPRYDEKKGMLWTTLTMNVKDYGKVKAFVGVKFTELGFIQFNGYAPADVFDSYLADFKNAFSDLQIDDAIRYKPPVPDSTPAVVQSTKGVWIMVGQAALIGCALWMIKILVMGVSSRLLSRVTSCSVKSQG